MDATKTVTLIFALTTVVITYCTLRVYNTTDRIPDPGSISVEGRSAFQNSEYQLQQYNTPCQSCDGGVPNVIIQYGVQRTATTLQFHILCLMMIMLHEDDVENVGCAFNKTPAKKYSVTKRHSMGPILGSLPEKSWVFMTSSPALSPTQQQEINATVVRIINKNIIIPYVADINLVLRRGYFIVHEYLPFFGITHEQFVHVAEYIRYWDILRLCCGKQMSIHWRLALHQRTNDKQQTHEESLSHHACEMYNISQVETNLMNTYIYKKFAHLKSLIKVIGKPSILDGKLDGNYCERCNANISKYHLMGNQPCA